MTGLRIDLVDNHVQWAEDIQETRSAKINFQMIGNTDLVAMADTSLLRVEWPVRYPVFPIGKATDVCTARAFYGYL